MARKRSGSSDPSAVISSSDEPAKRSYLKQSDVPMASLTEALRIPQAIFDHYAGKPTTPLNVARALQIDPNGSQIRVLSGAAIAFGLLEGGAQAASMSVTTLAKRIIRPQADGEETAAKKEAVLKPRVFLEFLQSYDKHPLPRTDIALNVLEELGVPRRRAEEVFERIVDSARSVGFISEIRDKSFVTLDGAASADGGVVNEVPNEAEGPIVSDGPDTSVTQANPRVTQSKGTALSVAIADDQRRRRVFITHGKDRALVEPIKKLLEYGELEPVVSVERQSVSKPVPEKFMDDMRGAGAAIIHVDAENTIVDKADVEHVILNPNVLIEIGAAMAF
jgi:CAP12/Pycsar effector protein, TIR domain